MMSLEPFDFQNHAVRVFFADPDNPLFVAHDVAAALGYRKPENAVARHCRRQTTTPKRGGGFLTLIPESDLYRMTFRSKLASAEEFTDWVTEEVLPTIRKTGRYEKPVDTLTPAQQRHVQRAVCVLARVPGNSFPAVYRSIKDRFQVASYKQVPGNRFSELCRFLGIAELSEAGAVKQSLIVRQERIAHAPAARAGQASRESAEQCLDVLRSLFTDALQVIGKG